MCVKEWILWSLCHFRDGDLSLSLTLSQTHTHTERLQECCPSTVFFFPPVLWCTSSFCVVWCEPPAPLFHSVYERESSVRDVTGLRLIHCRIVAADGTRSGITATMLHVRWLLGGPCCPLLDESRQFDVYTTFTFSVLWSGGKEWFNTIKPCDFMQTYLFPPQAFHSCR